MFGFSIVKPPFSFTDIKPLQIELAHFDYRICISPLVG